MNAPFCLRSRASVRCVAVRGEKGEQKKEREEKYYAVVSQALPTHRANLPETARAKQQYLYTS